jgi:hypothetical protein
MTAQENMNSKHTLQSVSDIFHSREWKQNMFLRPAQKQLSTALLHILKISHSIIHIYYVYAYKSNINFPLY